MTNNLNRINRIKFFQKENILNHIRDIVLISFIGFFITFISDPGFVSNSWEHLKFTFLYNVTIGTALWKGNEFISHVVFAIYHGDNYINKKLMVNMIVAMIYTVICSIGLNFLWIRFSNLGHFIGENLTILVMIQIFITIIITTIFISIGFYRFWRESLIEQGKLKSEALELQLQALKNQVNPHFLFNSLNTLTSLVETDQNQAVKYIKKLSDVYRYVLEYKDRDLIPVQTEIRCVESFVYLQKIRFGDSLSITIDAFSPQKVVIPLSVQMLIENSIKHNIISRDQPLDILIFEEDNYLVVRNNLQRKSSVTGSNLVGLNNLKSRYESMTNRPFYIEETEKYFTVKVPLIPGN